MKICLKERAKVKGKNMKKSIVKFFLAVIMFGVAMWFSGCDCGLCKCVPGLDENRCSQPGETAQEGNLRHIREARVNHEEMNADIDRAMLYDKPSTLTPLRVP